MEKLLKQVGFIVLGLFIILSTTYINDFIATLGATPMAWVIFFGYWIIYLSMCYFVGKGFWEFGR